MKIVFTSSYKTFSKENTKNYTPNSYVLVFFKRYFFDMMTKHYFFLGYKYISLKIIFFDKNKKDIDLNVMQLMNLKHLC